MSYEVRYFTKSGNTKKLADAIAEELNVQAKTIEEELTEKVDVLFLGSSVYAAHVSKEVKKFLETNKDKIGLVVNFSTAAILTSTYNGVKKICNNNGIAISEKEFHCKGSFGPLHKNKPDQNDIADVKTFVNDFVSEK